MAEALDAATVDALLDRLAEDDAFRSRFEEDPDAALAELGYRGPVRLRPCLRGKLPGKQQLGAARDALRAQLTTQLSQEIFKV